jgi:hypothetical protein
MNKELLQDETTKTQKEVVIKDSGYEVVVNAATDKQRQICNMKQVRNQLYVKYFKYHYEVWDRMIAALERYAKDKGHDYILGTLDMIDPDVEYINKTKYLLWRSGFTINKDNKTFYKLV